MVAIQTQDLIGAALDWAAAECEGYDTAFTSAGDVIILREGVTDYFDPHRNWGWGGQIIEREGITISKEQGDWSAYFRDNLFEEDGSEHWSVGPTPLIAAQRCFVASKLGPTVEVPEELVP